MRGKIHNILILLFLLPALCLAVPVPIDFYTDGVIQDGDLYSTVRVFDDATVNMTGGTIKTYLELYDTSTFNAYGGAMDIAARITLFDSSILNLRKLEGGVTYGWANNLIEVAGGSDCQINFYSYGFSFEGNQLHGYWADGTPFAFMIRNIDTREAILFHEIPEPASLLLFGVGAFLLRKSRRLHTCFLLLVRCYEFGVGSQRTTTLSQMK